VADGSASPTDLVFTTPGTGFASVAAAGGGGSGRIYRTTDSGSSWTQVSASGSGVQGLHFVSPALGYAVGSDKLLLRTVDGGATWERQALAGAEGNPPLTTIRCSGPDTCLITVAGEDRLLRTPDGGATASSVSASSARINAVALSSPTRVVGVGNGGGTVTSDDCGVNFTTVGGGIEGVFTRLRASSSSAAYAAGREGRVARTLDGGRTWDSIGVSTADDLVDVAFPTADVGFALDISGTVLRTDNAGVTWRILDTGSSTRARAILAPTPRNVVLVGFTGIRRSTNGGESFTAARSRALLRVRLSGADRAGARLFAYGPRALVTSADGRAWRRLRVPRGAIGEADFVNARTGYLLQTSGRVLKTRNGGRRWTELLGVGGANLARDIAFGDPRNGFLAVLGAEGGSVLRTSDGGRSWQPQLITLTTMGDVAAAGRSVGYALSTESQLFGTASGGVAGQPSTLTLRPAARSVRRGQRLRVTGRLRPADGGERVLVHRRAGGRWFTQAVRVASNGAFSTVWRVRTTSRFVAQWRGDDAHRGDGTPAVTVGVRRR